MTPLLESQTVPVSAVIPTWHRAVPLHRTLNSLREQGTLPVEIIIVDGSSDSSTREITESFGSEASDLGCRVLWQAATKVGAAVQRNQGVALATQATIAFFDDDLLFEADCLARMWHALQSDDRLGGVNAMITNQRYFPPGRVSRLVFRLLDGKKAATYAGRVLGPAVNLLPEDGETLPEVVPVEWLNTTCTLYRLAALPRPPFSDHFTGYSLMEDVALSLEVARTWKLANARTARVYHDSQPGAHKSDIVALSRMALVNRHYVMTHVLERRRVRDYAKLVLWEAFQLAATAIRKKCTREFWRVLKGRFLALVDIIGSASHPVQPL